jgi:hypothetical protein
LEDSVQTHWQLAPIFDAPGHDLMALEQVFKGAAAAIRMAGAGNAVRMGVADRHPDLSGGDQVYDSTDWQGVDGAIEITIANGHVDQIEAICRAMRPLIATFAEVASVAVMAGPMFEMVPVRHGGTFLSLAFRRDPAISSQQFSEWWLNRHAQMAIPVMGPGLHAYDQVHVDMAVTELAAGAFGVPAVQYDAYDDLTWQDRYGFLKSCSDTAGMAELYQDEIGHIAAGTQRHALMVEVH